MYRRMRIPTSSSRCPATPILPPARVSEFAADVFGEVLHHKRVESVANATLGVLQGASLAVSAIGQGLALAQGSNCKHAIKQVDRLFSNRGLDVNHLFASWVPFIVAERTEVVLALDCTDCDADDQSTLVLSIVTSHGRSTPLLWKTVRKSQLAKRRNSVEDALLLRLRQVIPESVRVTILCDRGFADRKLYEYLKTELGFDYIVRLSIRNHRHRCQRPVTPCQGVAPAHSAGPDAARRTRDQGGLSRRCRGPSARPRHAGRVVPCNEPNGLECSADREAVRQTLYDGGDLPRPKGSPLRNGPQSDSHFRPQTQVYCPRPKQTGAVP